MATRKKAPKAKGTKRSTSEQESRTEVLLEDIRAQNRVVIEAVLSERQARTREIAELREDFAARFDVLESVAREHTRILGEHTQRFERLESVAQEHTRILGEHTQRFDRLEAKLDAKADASLEQRVASLERKSG